MRSSEVTPSAPLTLRGVTEEGKPTPAPLLGGEETTGTAPRRGSPILALLHCKRGE
jgi:hypothetical protein